MIYRVLNITRKLFSAANISKTNKMNLEKCHFRYIQKEETVNITFLLQVKESVRQFNFSRKPTEDLLSLFNRMSTNIQKAIKKAYKKKAPKSLEIKIELFDIKDASINEQSTCWDLFNTKGPVHLKIDSHVFEVVFNAPWIVSIQLPQSILAGFPTYPEHFIIHYGDKDFSIFKWYMGSNSNGNWKFVSEGYCYTPTITDIGMNLKIECIPGDSKTTGPSVEAVSKNVVEAGPGKCPFEIRHMFTQSTLEDKSFRCVTYNILADLYCDSEFTRTVLHPYCPPYALSIDYRKQLILKELIGYNADVICLQEVDVKIFNHYLQPFLKTTGLNGLFYKKGKEVAEGLAVFYRKNRFKLVGEDKIVMSEAILNQPYLQNIWDAIKDNIPLKERLLDRSTVASATYLQSCDHPNEILIVGNTHLYFHPDADHIRLIQGGIFIYWINYLRRTILEKFPGKKSSVILCGDFNSVPSCGIYQLFTTGLAQYSLPDWKSNVEEAVSGLNLQQETILESACGTPEFTNFTAGFADCLDYIFYDKARFQVEQVVPLPSIEELKAHTALPSIVFPSDHIALISDLSFV